MYVVSSDGTMYTVSSLRREVAVHERHLILIFEVAHGAKPADQQLRALLATRNRRAGRSKLFTSTRGSFATGAPNQLDALLAP